MMRGPSEKESIRHEGDNVDYYSLQILYCPALIHVLFCLFVFLVLFCFVFVVCLFVCLFWFVTAC